MYELRFAKDVAKDLLKLPPFHRKTIMNAAETMLLNEPTTPSRNRKLLTNLNPPWCSEPPIWELRVGDYRVFYDVSEKENVVFVRAVRKKPAGKTTEEIL